MANQIATLTVQQLERAIAIRQQIDKLQAELDSLGSDAPQGATAGRRGLRRMSPAARARIAEGMKARWAARKNMATVKPGKKTRTMSPEAREKIAAAQRERWAKSRVSK